MHCVRLKNITLHSGNGRESLKSPFKISGEGILMLNLTALQLTQIGCKLACFPCYPYVLQGGESTIVKQMCFSLSGI